MSRPDKEYPYKSLLTQYARQNRKAGNIAEIRMWTNLLSNREITGYKWTKQKPILSFIPDFYCAELKIAIEIDGESHNEKIAYDQKRTSLLQQFNIKVIRYINRDVLYNIDGVYEDLKEKIILRESELGLKTRF